MTHHPEKSKKINKKDIDTSELEKYPKEILRVALSIMKEQNIETHATTNDLKYRHRRNINVCLRNL